MNFSNNFINYKTIRNGILLLILFLIMKNAIYFLIVLMVIFAVNRNVTNMKKVDSGYHVTNLDGRRSPNQKKVMCVIWYSHSIMKINENDSYHKK